MCEHMASVRALRAQLQAQVFEEFKEHISVTMSQEVIDMLADAAQVVTVLGADAGEQAHAVAVRARAR